MLKKINYVFKAVELTALGMEVGFALTTLLNYVNGVQVKPSPVMLIAIPVIAISMALAQVIVDAINKKEEK